MNGYIHNSIIFDNTGVKSRSRCHCFKPVLLILNLHWIVIRNTLIAGIFLFVVIVTVLVIVKTTGSKTNEITFQDPFYNGSLGNHSVIYRKQWGGVPPKSTPIRLKHPVDTLIVSCSLKDFCNTSDTCASAVRNLQKSHQSVRRFPDVGYNFMIGGDGGIYVGTGWDYRNFHRKTSIGIDFLGNFVYDKLTEDMIDAFHQLVHQGLMLRKLSREYKLVGENQTDPTVYLSPGPNVIKFMETWPHFYNKTWF